MNETPQLVRDDPWLEPYAGAIVGRLDHYRHTLAAIDDECGSLQAHSTAHKYAGIHFVPSAECWMIREWAPAAKAVSLIGDFNDWNRESHPLAPADRGMWQLRLGGAGSVSVRRVRIPGQCTRRENQRRQRQQQRSDADW